MTSYIVAIDGGQSTTQAVLADLEGHLLAAGWAGPANHIHEPGGPERFRAAVTRSLEEACAEIDFEQVRLVSMGMTGGRANMLALAQELLPSDRVALVPDSVSAHAGALAGEPGVIIIAGGGSIAYGKDPAGKDATIGGFGYMVGDEGSAYWITIEAIRAGFRGLDGRGPKTIILDKIIEKYQLENPREIHRLLYSQKLTRPEIVLLASVVAEAEREGDKVARDVLDRAGHELGILARTALRALKMPEGTVSWVGGVWRIGEPVMAAFQDEIFSEFPNARLEPPRFPPLIGALLLGLRQLGIEPDERIFDNIKHSLPAIGRMK